MREPFHPSTAAASRHAGRRHALLGLALLASLGAPWAIRPAQAQSVFERLLESARQRAANILPGIGVVPGIGGEIGIAAPHYVAQVFQQILIRGDLTKVANAEQMGQVVGTATVMIDIAASGQLLGVKVTATTGQGRALADRAVEAVRRVAPFPVPVMADRGPAKRVILEEVWVFNAQGLWQLQPLVERARQDTGSSSG